MEQPEIEPDAKRLSDAIGDAVADLVSGWAMAEAWREGRGANCDDVMDQFCQLSECDLVDLAMEKIQANQ